MSKQNFARISLLALTLIYNFFFWGEKLGINLLIFTSLLFTALYFINKESFKSLNVILTCTGTLLLAAFVAYNNSALAIVIFFLSLVSCVGFIHQKELKATVSAILTAFVSYLALPYNVAEELKFAFGKYRYFNSVFRFVKLSVLPLAVVVIFYMIYINANPIFAQASSEFWAFTDNFFVYLLNNFPFTRFLFITLGLVLLMGILYNRNINLLVKLEAKLKDFLIKKDTSALPPEELQKETASTMNEYRTGVILLVMVNALIVILNFIDIKYYWFGFTYYEGYDLKQFVHEGTYLLIYSILLSMGILLYYFRGRLNFYENNNLIKWLAYLWIFQNGIMAISVGVRNYYYIYYSHSLAYKRIGLIIFLVITFIGLVTLYFKIRNKTTFYNLFKVNSWAAYAVLLVASSFNWGLIIAEFNFTNPNKEKIDYDFMVSLSNSALPVLDRNKELLNRPISDRWWSDSSENGQELLKQRINNFLEEQESYSWLSWNYSDAVTKSYFAGRK